MRVGVLAVVAMSSVVCFAAEKRELPEAPDVPVLSFSAATPPVKAVRFERGRVSLREPEFQPAVSPLYSMPLVSAAMRLGGHNFNTDDGSSLDAFAICYRLNRRASVQVIPGDPAPVKIPVVTMKNNMGVTLGMVYRMSRSH